MSTESERKRLSTLLLPVTVFCRGREGEVQQVSIGRLGLQDQSGMGGIIECTVEPTA